MTVSARLSSECPVPAECGQNLICRSYIPNSRVALVCSARSSQTKALGTTNLLLQASREALQPPSSRPPSTSGSQTPYFPKRVGSGFFGGDDKATPRQGANGMSASMMSSISSLRELDLTGARSSSPSPFTSSGRRSPTSPTTPGIPSNGWNGRDKEESGGFHDTVDLLKRGHLEAAKNTVRAGLLREELEEEIERDCESLRSFLQAAQVGTGQGTTLITDHR